jgi:hypothetical protein
VIGIQGGCRSSEGILERLELVLAGYVEETLEQMYHILLPWIDHGFVSELLDSHKDAYSIAHLFNTHLLQDLLIAFD